MTALHEIIGHGSGKMNPKLTHDPGFYLKEYYSTLEEGRADLMALWSVWDPKARELGLLSNLDVAKVMYYDAVRVAITQLRRIPKGDTIEEDHERDRQLIVNYIRDKTRRDRGSEAQWKNLSRNSRLRQDAARSGNASGGADAHQSGRRLQRD